jgi:hypothetical protein
MSSTTDGRMGILPYRNSLRLYAIKNRISRTIFENRNALGSADLFVIPAEAGIQCLYLTGFRLRGNDETE